MDQPGNALPILLVVSWTGNINISLSPFAPENLVSWDGFGSSTVPRLPAHLHTQAESGACFRGSSRAPRRRPFIYYLNRHTTPSGQSRVYRVTHLRTDGVHCRESAGTGPVNLKVVPNGRVLPWQVTIDQLICAWLSFPHPLLLVYKVGMAWYEVLYRQCI